MSDLLIVNGMKFPCPLHGLVVTTTQTVNAGRNTNNAAIGQKVGRRLYKISNLEWACLDIPTWTAMRAAIEPFYFPVTFTDDCNIRRTITMYPGDTNAEPLTADGVFYTKHRTCKFNLIDAGLE